jgi:dihydropyrimidine dehydrogenase (NAD+) subunit PreT
VFESNAALFRRAPESGRRVAVVGAGPAGFACAHMLARMGHGVVVFDAQAKAGGLNEYGIARYKVLDFAAREIEWLLGIGGIEVRQGQTLGGNLQLADLRRDYDAVFLAFGLAGVNALGVEGEGLGGVRDAVGYIAEIRQAADLASLPVGRRVVVIGGGNTAIDAAVQSRKLGAESVTLAYRRGAAQMSATVAEREFAQTQGVSLVEWVQPRRFVGVAGTVAAVEFEYTRLDAQGRLSGSGEMLTIPADMVLKAVGQVLAPSGEMPEVKKGRIVVDVDNATSLPGVWAGGDCVFSAIDLTVQAVEDGKQAALAIGRALAMNKPDRG